MLVSTIALGLGATAREIALAAPSSSPTDANVQDNKPQNIDPWMERLSGLKDQLGCSDDEWPVIAERIEAVVKMNYDRHRFGHFKLSKPSTDGQPTGTPNSATVAIKSATVHVGERGSAIADMADAYSKLISLGSQENPPIAEIKAALNDYRNARAKSDAELAAARSSLRELVSLKQEADLVVMGILD